MEDTNQRGELTTNLCVALLDWRARGRHKYKTSLSSKSPCKTCIKTITLYCYAASMLKSSWTNYREARKKERLEGEVKQLKTALEARQADIKTKSSAAQQSEEQVKRLEQMLRESQVATDRVQKEFNILNEKVQKLHHDLEDQIHTNTQLLAENSQKALELKQKEEDILQVKVSNFADNDCGCFCCQPSAAVFYHVVGFKQKGEDVLQIEVSTPAEEEV